jgi:hypothetical protein
MSPHGDTGVPKEGGGGMRKKLVVLGVVTSLIGSGVVIGAMVPAASQQPRTTFTVCDRNRGGYNKEIDVGRNGFSAGDGILEVDTLRRPKSGAKVGRLVLRATVVRVFRRQQDSLVVGDFTATFRNGKITAYGHATFRKFQAEGAKFAITGGTGSYNDVRGVVVVRLGQCGGKLGTRSTFNLV